MVETQVTVKNIYQYVKFKKIEVIQRTGPYFVKSELQIFCSIFYVQRGDLQ